MPPPMPPREIDPLAHAVLTALHAHAEASALVLGDAFALGHYLDYRHTHDLDAWWAPGATAAAQEAALRVVRDILHTLAAAEGLSVRERAWGDVQSLWDLRRRRNPDQDEQAARAQVCYHLVALEAHRPLAAMPDAERARRLRSLPAGPFDGIRGLSPDLWLASRADHHSGGALGGMGPAA